MTRIASPIVALVLCAGACREAVGPRPDASTTQGSTAVQIVLTVGQDVRVDSLLRLGFVSVPADSRCPSMLMCFWAGDAEVEIAHALGTGPTSPDTLHTTLAPRVAQFGSYAITLVDLMPYPERPASIPLDEYAVRLRIERIKP
jgi:hypothetical protein